jgi:ABC-2 type transport system ATP-binding protein
MIELKDLTKEYGSFRAVNNLSFTVHPGEIFGFLGVNGAGKTTTIRMLTGILQPTSGSITIDGVRMSEDPIHVKGITGYIPDRPYLYNKLTGYEFLRFCADLYNVPKEVTEPRVEALLREYMLLDWANELVESYSHGMKQRLATCAALVHDPKVLIIDEPMVGLDPRGARKLKDSLKAYAAEGKTILLSTHSLPVAEEIADRLAIIHRGTLVALGSVKEIMSSAESSNSNLEAIFIQLTNEAEDARA